MKTIEKCECSGCNEKFEVQTLNRVVPNGELFCEDCFPEAQDQYEEYLEYLADQ